MAYEGRILPHIGKMHSTTTAVFIACRSVFCLDTDAERLKTAKRRAERIMMIQGRHFVKNMEQHKHREGAGYSRER